MKRMVQSVIALCFFAMISTGYTAAAQAAPGSLGRIDVKSATQADHGIQATRVGYWRRYGHRRHWRWGRWRHRHWGHRRYGHRRLGYRHYGYRRWGYRPYYRHSYYRRPYYRYRRHGYHRPFYRSGYHRPYYRRYYGSSIRVRLPGIRFDIR